MILVLDIIKSGKNKPLQKSFRFERINSVIGRSDEADYQLTDPHNYISGKHVSILFQDNQYYLVDNSTNGTFLKNPYQKLPKGIPYPIAPSDIFIIGDHELQARIDDNAYGDDFIVGSFTPVPEPLAAIEELIPDNDFLFEDDDSSTILHGDAYTCNKPVDVIELYEPTPLRVDEEDEEISETFIPENGTFHENIRIPKMLLTPENLIAVLEKRLNFSLDAMNEEARVNLFNDIADVVLNATQAVPALQSLQKQISQYNASGKGQL